MAQRAAIVTGASSGIGLAIARMLGEEGYALTVAARRPDKLRAAADGLRADGFEVLDVAAMLSEELTDLLPACEALVVPSTFPEAFGMVAAEGAACGALPICAEHSGLAEVASALAQSVPPPVHPWLAFPVEGDPVRGIAERV